MIDPVLPFSFISTSLPLTLLGTVDVLPCTPSYFEPFACAVPCAEEAPWLIFYTYSSFFLFIIQLKSPDKVCSPFCNFL